MTIAILCSGQGHQHSGMFDLLASAPETQRIFAAAACHLEGSDPRDMVRRPGVDLHVNHLAQILCCTQALAVWAIVAPILAEPVVVAGYSVGEVSAWSVAGAMSPQTALEIVARRARLMDSHTKVAAGLVSIGGLDMGRLAPILEQWSAYLSIRIGEDQSVIGGTRASIDRVTHAAQRAGARRTTPIAVDVASHTPLLCEAADIFAAELCDRTDIAMPTHRLLSGIDGDGVTRVDIGLAKLGQQMAATIEWSSCLDACRAAGASRVLELGPGNALAAMAKSSIGLDESRSASDFRTREGLLRWVQRNLRGSDSTIRA